MRKQLRALDLFAGVGGSSCGATAAGVRIVGAVDTWPLARDTYTANFPDVNFFLERCEEVRLDELADTIGKIDLIIASPECTSHTCAKGSAPRSEISRRTAFQVIRFAQKLTPRWIVVENVVHMRTWRSYNRWLEGIKKLGYHVREQVINAADHGVPQARRRLFIMCDRVEVPRTVKARKRKRLTAAAIVDCTDTFDFSPLRTNRRAKPTLERAQRAMAAVGTRAPFLLVYYGSDAAGGWQSLSSPLRTVTTLDRFAYVKPAARGHLMRMLQVPEIKAAMGFPRSYRLDHGSRRERIKLLGNAVCPPVMSAVVENLIGATGRR